MNLTRARELREERARLFKEAHDTWNASKRTKEDEAKFNAALDKCEELKKTIDTEERAEKVEGEFKPGGAPPSGQPGLAHLTDEGRQKRYREAWRHAMCFDGPEQYGFRGISQEDRQVIREFRDMGTGGGNALQGTGGGYFVPVGFIDEVEEAMKWYGDMLNSSTIMTTATGQPLPHPTDNDTTVTGELIGESQPVTEADVTLGNIVFNAYKYSTKMVKISIELLQDSAFDFDGYLKDKFAIRLGRILNTHFTTGTGSSQPNGIITAATVGPTAAGASTNDGGAETGGTSIGTGDLVELEHSVDKAYRRGASFMGHDLTIKSLKKLLDKYGRPIWLPGIAVNAPDTILGYTYYTNNDMATIAVNAKTLLFGQLKKYTVRRVKELAVLRLVERFADYGQVAFIGFARYDGQLLDAGTHPVKYLVQAAS